MTGVQTCALPICSAYSDFTWDFARDLFSPGELNSEQYWDDVVQIEITELQLLTSTIRLMYTQTTGATPEIMYSTNLLSTGNISTAETNYSGPTESNGIYTITFDKRTNNPVYFYKLVTTNSP
mgnify:CR=1 FL=1